MFTSRKTASLLVAVLVYVCALLLSTSQTTTLCHAQEKVDGLGPEVEVLIPEKVGKFLNTHKPCLIMLAAGFCGHCTRMRPALSELAKKMKGVARIGYIDADKHRTIAQQFRVEGFPTIKYWKMTEPGKKRKLADSQDYVGPREAASLQSALLNAIRNNFKYVIQKEDILNAAQAASTGKVFALITNKDKVAPLFSVLSGSPHFHEKLNFVALRATNPKTKQVHQDIGSPSFPSMLVYDKEDTELKSPIAYEGKIEYESIAKFLLNIVKGDSASSSSSSSSESAGNEEQQQDSSAGGEEEEKPAAAPSNKKPKKALPVEVLPITTELVQDHCSGNAASRKQPFCVVLFSEEGAVAKNVKDYFSTEPLLFFTASGGDLSAAGKAFPEDASSSKDTLAALVFRTTKVGGVTKYAWIDGQTDTDLKNNLALVLQGLIKFNKAEILPKFE